MKEEEQTEQLTPAQMERRAERRKNRRERQKRRRRALMKKWGIGLGAACVVAAAVLGVKTLAGPKEVPQPQQDPQPAPTPVEPAVLPAEPELPVVWRPEETENTLALGEEINSEFAVLIDGNTGEVLAGKNAYERMYPASMTKVMTVLAAAELVDDLDAQVTIPIEITDYCYVNGCSVVGFEIGETVRVEDLFYGTVLPSGADAALALAEYAAGSQEAFVEKMNEKARELGVGETTHFTNCVGIYDDENYTTAYDMAVIMKAAVENEFCRRVLSAHTYTIPGNEVHPEGMPMSNWFLRRIEDQDNGGTEVVCGKTGYVPQARSCAVSYGEGADGGAWFCVTGKAGSSWLCLYDHSALYRLAAGGSAPEGTGEPGAE